MINIKKKEIKLKIFEITLKTLYLVYFLVFVV